MLVAASTGDSAMVPAMAAGSPESASHASTTIERLGSRPEVQHPHDRGAAVVPEGRPAHLHHRVDAADEAGVPDHDRRPIEKPTVTTLR